MPAQSYYKYQQGIPTVAGGANTGIMGALQHPDQFAHDDFLAKHLQSMGMRRAGNPFATNGGFQSRTYPQYDQPQIHGYSGGGIPTNLFSQLTGRGPTAADVEQANGGSLGPQHNQMGSLAEFDAMQQNMTPWQQLQMAAGAPMTAARPSPIAHSIPITADNADNIPPNAMMAADGGEIPMGQPVVVGERGPELMVPNQNATVIPHEYLPTHYLMKGDIMGYLKHFIR